jgi:hypothetical protein
MKKHKTQGAAPAEPDAAPIQNHRNSFEIIPAGEVGPAGHAGDYPQHGFAAAYRKAREAHAELKSAPKRDWPNWWKLAGGIGAARDEAMRLAAKNAPEGKGYAIHFAAVLKRERLSESDGIDSSTRRDLFRMLKHRVEIEAWLESLDPAQRMKINHPTALIRKWRKTPEGRAAMPPRPSNATRRVGNAELRRQLEQKDERIKELEQERDQAKRESAPQFTDPGEIDPAEVLTVLADRVDDLIQAGDDDELALFADELSVHADCIRKHQKAQKAQKQKLLKATSSRQKKRPIDDSESER